jgi:hypothetical protein
MSTKSSECWEIDPQARGLRIIISSRLSLNLPFDQFAFGELSTNDTGQCLKLVFATHEILVEGQNLRRLDIAMQRMELSLIAIASTGFERTANPGQPVILKIDVKEIIPTKKQASTQTNSTD